MTNSVPVFGDAQMFPYTTTMTFVGTGTICWTALGYDSGFNMLAPENDFKSALCGGSARAGRTSYSNYGMFA